jgi:dTDP-4-dehydrorhamnose 3,5-epimerase
MRIQSTPIAGVFIIEPDVFPDARGVFVRAWEESELRTEGLDTRIVQCSVSTNSTRGTLRGMHYQRAPYDGAKTVRVTRGAVYDVAVDLRPDSPSFRNWTGVELSADNRRSIYVPAGCAHGYLSLVDDAEVLYFVSTPYAPDHQSGVRWDDPAFNIAWPVAPTAINDRDRTYPDFLTSRP